MTCYLCGGTGRISGGDDDGAPCPQCAVLSGLSVRVAELEAAAGKAAVECARLADQATVALLERDVARAELARLGAELRQARFVASGEALAKPT